MKRILLTIIFISLYSSAYSQYNPGARQIALSNSDVALSNDVFAIFNNPAGLAQMNWREVGLYYSPSPFGLKELANGFIAYHEPFSFGSIAIGGMTYGFELYKESKFLASYSYNYKNNFFAGIALNFHTVSIQNYGNASAFYINFGGIAYLTDFIRWGFFVHNINRASFVDEDDQIPMIFNSGFSYDIINELTANFSVEKDIRYNASIQFGVEYSIIKYVTLRTGFSNEPSRYSAGVGINYSLFSLDYAMFTHPDLGLTHQAGLIISFGKSGTRNEMIRNFLQSE